MALVQATRAEPFWNSLGHDVYGFGVLGALRPSFRSALGLDRAEQDDLGRTTRAGLCRQFFFVRRCMRCLVFQRALSLNFGSILCLDRVVPGGPGPGYQGRVFRSPWVKVYVVPAVFEGADPEFRIRFGLGPGRTWWSGPGPGLSRRVTAKF